MRDFEENRCLILLNCSGGLERFTEIDTDTVLHVNSIIKFGDAGFLRDIFTNGWGQKTSGNSICSMSLDIMLCFTPVH